MNLHTLLKTEVSSDTLRSYMGKAADDISDHRDTIKHGGSVKGGNPIANRYRDKAVADAKDKLQKRRAGLVKAAAKFASKDTNEATITETLIDKILGRKSKDERREMLLRAAKQSNQGRPPATAEKRLTKEAVDTPMKQHVGDCRNSFDEDGECTNRHLPYRDTSHFAHGEENAKHVTKEEFEKHAQIPKYLTKIHNHKNTSHLHDVDHDVHMLYDSKKDVHHFFTSHK